LTPAGAVWSCQNGSHYKAVLVEASGCGDYSRTVLDDIHLNPGARWAGAGRRSAMTARKGHLR